MILELKVSQFAVIDSLSVRFLRPGLNVLTGETGAGKSVLLKALSLLLGGKASPDLIRSGCEQAVIEGAFDLTDRTDVKAILSEQGLESGEDLLVLRRLISRAGKHRLYINGSLATLNVLDQIAPKLLEITGQHEHHTLTKPAAQLDVLDEYAGLLDLREKFLISFTRARELREEIASLSSKARDREQRLDFLRYQIAEIEQFNPVTGEDGELVLQTQRARSSTRLLTFAQKAEDVLYSGTGSVHERLGELVDEGSGLSELDPKLKAPVASLREAAVLIEDSAFSFRDYSKNESVDESSLENLESRLSDLKKLQKKYGATVEDILAFQANAHAECEALEKSDENIKELSQQLAKLEVEITDLAQKLHSKRLSSSKKLVTGINAELHELNMKGAEFSVTVVQTSEILSTGQDDVQFLIKASPKDEARPISKVASGGELSRIMLALKQVATVSKVPMTFLFDEVDTGVSGPTAEKVGKKLKSIARGHQVICITHLPQVACFADAHFLITKEVSKGLVKSDVTELSSSDRVKELGRLISGEKITATSIAHAKQMLAHAKN